MRLRDKENLLVGIVMASFLPTDQKTELIEIIRKEAEKDCWIPVSERLPENDNLILCYGGGFCMCAFFKGRFNDFDENGYPYEVTGITHWMPLPEVPKEVDK